MIALAALTAMAMLASAPRAPQAPQTVRSIASDTWINTRALRADDLGGRVIVLDFWTFG